MNLDLMVGLTAKTMCKLRNILVFYPPHIAHALILVCSISIPVLLRRKKQSIPIWRDSKTREPLFYQSIQRQNVHCLRSLYPMCMVSLQKRGNQIGKRWRLDG